MQLLHLRTKILEYAGWLVSVALLETSAMIVEVARWFAMVLA
jgi:hypothetical protein